MRPVTAAPRLPVVLALRLHLFFANWTLKGLWAGKGRQVRGGRATRVEAGQSARLVDPARSACIDDLACSDATHTSEPSGKKPSSC